MNKIMLRSTKLINFDLRKQSYYLQPLIQKNINVSVSLNHGIHSSNLLYCKAPESKSNDIVMPQENIIQKLYSKVFRGVPKSKLKASGYILLTQCSQLPNLVEFFRVFDMPDTFYSWFLVTELHVWMLSSRLMNEGEYGKITRNAMVEALWSDCEMRAKSLGDLPASIRSKQILSISEEFQAALFVYDEGLLGDDKDLANALWRRFFLSMRASEEEAVPDMEKVALLVNYVRSTIHKLDNTDGVTLLIKSLVQWAPLQETINDR